MTPGEKALVLGGGILTLLVFASLVAARVRRRAGTPAARAVADNLYARIQAWWVMVFILGAAYCFGEVTTLVLFGLLSFFALREFITLTPTRAADHKALAVAFFALIPAQYTLIGIDWYNLYAILIPVYGFLLLPSLGTLGQDTEQYLERTAKIQWGVFVTVYCISHAPALLLLRIPGYENQSALLLFYLILVVQISDVLQYVAGKLLGRTPVAPGVSPSKTVEGLVYGGLGAVLVGTGLWWVTPFSPWQAAGLSAMIVITGFMGGLVLSAVKRSLGAKDWGTLIRGHGGVLDRLDSVSFAAPVFFHLVRYFFTP
jgi:phosphatidate cytidylyltransferase